MAREQKEASRFKLGDSMSVIWKRSSHKVTEDFSAKVLRPQFPDAFLRPRLFHRLDQARELPLTWICGPPGAGKTTLVSSYVERAGTPCLWYQLDERDADPATIFRYLRLAAEKSRLKRAGSLPQFLLEDVTYLKGFCRNFFEELFARLSAPFLLVLDNYQELPADSPVQKLLVLALESFPPGGNLFVLSRGAPTAAFASYRIRNPVALLEWNELRFTKTETRTFLRRRG
ncbi:MAG TPA: hypothetical protein ENJ31_13185, partial [Anaerolineae bacterium]|nr:hypothetical protein [Anaerolineae bacterium]